MIRWELNTYKKIPIITVDKSNGIHMCIKTKQDAKNNAIINQDRIYYRYSGTTNEIKYTDLQSKIESIIENKVNESIAQFSTRNADGNVN